MGSILQSYTTYTTPVAVIKSAITETQLGNVGTSVTVTVSVSWSVTYSFSWSWSG